MGSEAAGTEFWEGWVSTGAVGGEGAIGSGGGQGPSRSGPAGLQEGAGGGGQGRAAAGRGVCRGGCGGRLGGAGWLYGGSRGGRHPLLGPLGRVEPLPQGAGSWGLGLPPLLLLLLQERGLGAPATAADTPPVAVVGQLPACLGERPTGPVGSRCC